MTERTRTRLLAGAIGAIAAVVVLAAGWWLGGIWTDDEPVDGSFVLAEPGVFQQPLDDVNADATGTQLPTARLTDADGVERTLAEFRGAPLVVNLWFSNCAPCRRELRDFARVHADVGDEVQFVGVNPFDTVDAMERFASERDVGYALWRDDRRELTQALDIVGYPVTLFVDADGNVVRQTGEIDEAGLRSAIAELF
jgi:peroxiredoxin